MLYKILFLFFSLLPLISSGQFSVEGRVTDEQEVPLPFSNAVAIDSIFNEIEEGAITDENGLFQLNNLNQGNYKIIISVIGFKEFTKNITVNRDINLGLIKLKPSSVELDEVVIEGRKKIIQKKIDRLVFNVENSIQSTGGNSIDLLSVTPGIKIQGDRILMIGKTSINVMINDRPVQLSGAELMNYLRSLPSDDIKRIEVITAPPAKYDAEGNSGIVNIILKSGIANSWKSDIRTTYTQYSYPYANLGTSFDLNYNRLSFSAGVSYSNGSKLIDYNNTFFFENQTWQTERPQRSFYEPLLNTRFNLSYKISEKLEVGGQYIGSFNKYRDVNNNDITRIIDNTSKETDSILRTISSGSQQNPSHSISIFNEYKIDETGKQISLILDYFDYDDSNTRMYSTATLLPNGERTPEGFESGRNIGDQNIRNYAATTEVELPLKNISLNLGGKISSTTTESDLKFFDLTDGSPILDEYKSNQFTFDENIQAIYFSFSTNLSERWETKVGARFEAAQTEGFSKQLNETNVFNYEELFPSFYLSFKPDKDNSLSINYNKRISRPSFNYLNPFRITKNPFSFVQGNPFLRPSFTDNVEFSHIFKNNLVSSFYISKSDDLFYQIAVIDSETNIQTIIPENFYNQWSYGVSESYSLNIKKFLESYNSINLYYSNNETILPTVELNDYEIGAYFSTNNNIFLNSQKTMIFNINFWYNAPTSGNLYTYGSSYELNLGLRVLLANKKLIFNLQGNDILRSSRFLDVAISNGIRQEYLNYYDNRNLKFSIVYRFGNEKIKNQKKRSGNEEEQKRIKN